MGPDDQEQCVGSYVFLAFGPWEFSAAAFLGWPDQSAQVPSPAPNFSSFFLSLTSCLKFTEVVPQEFFLQTGD